jgi:hypothetical protein
MHVDRVASVQMRPQKLRFSIFMTWTKQGCRMAYFNTQKSILGMFWRALVYKMRVYFGLFWIFWIFGTYILWLMGNFVVIRYIFPQFGKLCPEKIWQPWNEIVTSTFFVSIFFDFFDGKLEKSFDALTWLRNRVTRLVEFSAFGLFFTLVIFCKSFM